MRKWRDGKIVKTGARCAAQRKLGRDVRLTVPAPSWASNDTPGSAFLRPGEAEEVTVAALQLFNEQRVKGNDAGVAEARKRLDGMCAGIVERTKQTTASNRRQNLLRRDARRADQDWIKRRAERRMAKRAVEKAAKK